MIPPNKIKIYTTGFSILELLLVIAIILVLSATALIAINPAGQLAQARDDVRESHIQQIWQAANEKHILAGDWVCDSGRLPRDLDGENKPVFRDITTETGGYDLMACLYPDVLANILIDPQTGWDNGVEDYYTGYQVWQHPVTKRISIRSKYAETKALVQGEDLDSDVTIANVKVFTGWAWSENIGWLAINASTGGGEIDYGVGVLESDSLSGFGWQRGVEGEEAGGLGWLKFDAEPAGAESWPNCPASTCPDGSPDYSAEIDWSSGRITGWARFCSGTINNDCNSASQSDWDGWVLLGPIVKNDTHHGVRLSGDFEGGELIGWAWGSEPVGWISFNCNNQNVCATSNYQVIMEDAHPPED